MITDRTSALLVKGAGTAPRPPAVSLEQEGLHLWALRQPWTDRGPKRMVMSELDDDERTRALSFVRPLDRLLYVSAHIALRRLLSAYTGILPGELVLGRDTCPKCGGPHGRPVVADSPVPVYFSLSHSHGLAIIGISGAPVGVDVERVPSLETAELCLPELHPEERAEISQLPVDGWPMAFGRLWTRKEAYLKGIGTGLSRDLGADYLGERRGTGAPAGPPGWTVRNVPGYPGHIAAVAVVTGADQWSITRRLPMECLYAEDPDDAIGLIAAAKLQLCTGLPAAANVSVEPR